LRIQLGSDSFGAIADKLKFVATEQKTWREASLATDYEDVGAG
jgi:hypothetical protein